MAAAQTQMRAEVLEIPVAAERLLANGGDAISRAADAVRARDPQFMVSVARGSSDHAATYLKYASELLLATPLASIGPSIASIYGRNLRLAGSVCLSVSQSGKSPDIVEMARMARAGGALSIAMTNHPDSPLAQVADHTLNLHAGREISVAATKTFVNSAIAGIWFLAECADDDALRKAIADLLRRNWRKPYSLIGQRCARPWGAQLDLLPGARASLCHCERSRIEVQRNLSNPCRVLFIC
uniref:SIS domain-containing protein n=1 Tax=Yoonia sp. GPGPB17 TaxID=3026147 RepID=UPI0030EDD4BE